MFRNPMSRRSVATLILAGVLWFIVEVLVWASLKDFEEYGTWFAVLLAIATSAYCTWKARRLTVLAVVLGIIQVTVGAVAFVQRTFLVAESPPVDASLRDCLASSESVVILVLELASGIIYWRARRRWSVAAKRSRSAEPGIHS